jgi:hypothetical protein
VSQTECVASFKSHGRDFLVLHKDSAAYLRADGRMIASLGGDLSVEESVAQGRLHAELFQIKEREQEVALLHRLYETPQTGEVKAIAANYTLLKLPPANNQKHPGDAVYAAFNHNGYAHTAQGWVFLGCFESVGELEAHAQEAQANGTLVFSRFKPASRWIAGLKKESKVMAYTTIGLVAAFAIAYGIRYVFSHWPVAIPLSMGAIFIGCAMAMWWKK